jgi:magnesium transporter
MFKKRHASAEFKPGTLVIPKDAPIPIIKAMAFSQTNLIEKTIPTSDLNILANEIHEIQSKSELLMWLDIQGLGSEEILLKIAEIFGLHVLTIADVVNIPQRPKAENLETHFLYIGSMMEPKNDCIYELDQLSVIWSKNFVLTFQESPEDVLDVVRNRIRAGKGHIRKAKGDYLAYAIIDASVDGYYPILEKFGENLEDLGNELIQNPGKKSLQHIYTAKRELLKMRRMIWPQREALNFLVREETPLINKDTRIYFRDTYDHLIQIIDVVETYRELAGNFIDIYLSSASMKMNEIMKLLTIIGTIFIPLTFFAGIYGMNFEYMPEIKYKYSYPIFWAAMIFMVVSMLIYFYRKGWIFNSEDAD